MGKRAQTYSDKIADENKPIGAPQWTLKGYNGKFQSAVSIACDK